MSEIKKIKKTPTKCFRFSFNSNTHASSAAVDSNQSSIQRTYIDLGKQSSVHSLKSVDSNKNSIQSEQTRVEDWDLKSELKAMTAKFRAEHSDVLEKSNVKNCRQTFQCVTTDLMKTIYAIKNDADRNKLNQYNLGLYLKRLALKIDKLNDKIDVSLESQRLNYLNLGNLWLKIIQMQLEILQE